MSQDVRQKTEQLGSSAPAAESLSLLVYDRPLHPELFRHYMDFRVTQTRYYADIWITGLQHVVCVTAGQRSMTEVVALETDLLPTRGVLTKFRFKGERDLEKAGPEGWHYMVSSQVETMDDALYKSVHHDLMRHAIKRGRYVAYDQWSDGDMLPFSYIDHEARDSEFHVHAFHAFPQERTLVKTQTIIEIAF